MPFKVLPRASVLGLRESVVVGGKYAVVVAGLAVAVEIEMGDEFAGNAEVRHRGRILDTIFSRIASRCSSHHSISHSAMPAHSGTSFRTM